MKISSSVKFAATFLAMAGPLLVNAIPESGSDVVAYADFDDGLDVRQLKIGSHEFSKRTAGGVYICTDINWGGTCGYKVQPLNTCIGLNSPWYHTISSFGPDAGTKCYLYSDKKCDPNCPIATQNCGFPTNPDGIVKPGYADLGTIGLNDYAGSFYCVAA